MSENEIISVPDRLKAPEPTTNQLKDIVDWLKLGDVVMLLNGKSARYLYHDCKEQDINKVRVIAVDAESFPGLLDDGEWNWYIEDAGFKSCTCKTVKQWLEAKYLYSFAV